MTGKKDGSGRPEVQQDSRPWPRPVRSRDTAFFWEGVDGGELRIQRCASCGTLRHPPRPMCAKCQSIEFDWIVSTGQGTIYSYVVLHRPAVPPFSYPNTLLLVELEEGTRLVSSLIDADGSEVHIGLPVEMEIVEVDPGLKLPLFRLSKRESAA